MWGIFSPANAKLIAMKGPIINNGQIDAKVRLHRTGIGIGVLFTRIGQFPDGR